MEHPTEITESKAYTLYKRVEILKNKLEDLYSELAVSKRERVYEIFEAEAELRAAQHDLNVFTDRIKKE